MKTNGTFLMIPTIQNGSSAALDRWYSEHPTKAAKSA
jgi:hypothetical protein